MLILAFLNPKTSEEKENYSETPQILSYTQAEKKMPGLSQKKIQYSPVRNKNKSVGLILFLGV